MPNEELDLREQLARIDQIQAETSKLVAEGNKYKAETRWFPWIPIISSSAISAVIAAIISHLWHG